jgi:hypothetical protein
MLQEEKDRAGKMKIVSEQEWHKNKTVFSAVTRVVSMSQIAPHSIEKTECIQICYASRGD